MAFRTFQDFLQPRPTDLERDLLEKFVSRYVSIGFPSPNDVEVVSRWNTGAGRITFFRHVGEVGCPDGNLSMGTYSHVELEGLEAGATVEVAIENKKVVWLNITVNGEAFWSGLETRWAIADPETAALPDGWPPQP